VSSAPPRPGCVLHRKYSDAKRLAEKYVKGKAAVISATVHVGKNGIKKMGTANPGHSTQEHFKGKVLMGEHPKWYGKKFTELVVHNPHRIQPKSISYLK